MDIRKQTQIMRWKKDNLQIFTLKEKVLSQLSFLEIVSSQRLKTNCVDVCLYKEWGWGTI